ncbi:hypothetical protein [Halalkalicoccus subterraneus]|uniref:hypothetical protein n=1 Tax=Halalkalicoccus subterraneus TaxID=2675002 RepID=UPI000EFAFDD0|nr:hypothetical protein [Halalkalicoccus subterraneus]
MSRTETSSRPDRVETPFTAVAEHLERFKAAIVDETDDTRLIEIAGELWDIVAAVEALLTTIDFEELPDAIAPEALPDVVDVETVPDAIAAGDAGEAIDLRELNEAIELRELWEAVDLPALRDAKRDLDIELADVIDTDADFGDEETETATGTGGAESRVGVGARREALLRSIGNATEAFRTALFEAHETLRAFYEHNRDSVGGTSRSASRPARGATLSRGPLADSASTRYSSVPARVRHSRTSNPPRIYGRRFQRAGRGSWK